MYSRQVVVERTQLALLDWAMVFLSLLGATWLRHAGGVLSPDGQPTAVPWSSYVAPALVVGLLFVALLRGQGLYRQCTPPLVEAYRVAKAATAGTLIAAAVTFFYRGYSYSRATVLLFYPLSILTLIGCRSLYRAYQKAMHTHRAAMRRVLIVGFGQVGQHLGRALLDNPGYYHLAGFLDDDPTKADGRLGEAAVVGRTADLRDSVRRLDIDEVFIAIPSASQKWMMSLIGECLRLKVRWSVVPNLCDLMLERIHVDRIAGLPLVTLRGSQVVGFNWLLKRIFDLAFAGLVLILIAPLWLAIAVGIKLTSRGPVLFRQTRIGLNGKPFSFLKFRSMRIRQGSAIHESFTANWIYGRTGNGNAPGESRSVGAAVASQERAASHPSVHKIVDDPRVTAVGRVLRRTSLDELPQFWNVLRGEMSVVGPRPPLPYEVHRYSEWHKRRLDVLPGITGLWQVSGRNRLSFDEMVRLDISYIETWDLEQDMKIVLKTVPAVLFGKAY